MEMAFTNAEHHFLCAEVVARMSHTALYLCLRGRGREMSQEVTCLPCKHEELSSNPKHGCKTICVSVTPEVE